LGHSTFLEIKENNVSYRYFLSFPHSWSLSEVEELAVYSEKVAPIGIVKQHAWLEIRLRDGTAVDTFYLINPEQVQEVVAASKQSSLFAGRVTMTPEHP
jgi:hypothetical protein